VRDNAEAEQHPILAGFRRDRFRVVSWLYKNRDMADSTQLLVMGRVGEGQIEPVAWTNRTKWDGDVFYTSLGHPGDFRNPAFEQLLLNAVNVLSHKTATQ